MNRVGAREMRTFEQAVRVVVVLGLMMPSVSFAQFTFADPGAPRAGAGRVDHNIYAPGMRFPMEGLAWANSQQDCHGVAPACDDDGGCPWTQGSGATPAKRSRKKYAP